ncbi:MAG: NUDIX hydrolase [Candidatus Micrarchaeia archaeon]
MRKHALPPMPSALAAGLLEDGERALFLARKNERGEELLEIPCVEVMAGENPVAALAAAFREQAGIDAEVHEILFERKHNAGTRKRRVRIPVLVFELTAKSHAVKPASGFCGYRWLAPADMGGKKLSRKTEWLR